MTGPQGLTADRLSNALIIASLEHEQLGDVVKRAAQYAAEGYTTFFETNPQTGHVCLWRHGA